MTNKIEPLAENFLQDVWRIEQDAHSHPWTQSMINDVASRGACHHVLLCDEEVVGYFYAQNIVGEVTLLNIAIDPQRQGKGLGKVLLEYFLTMCEDAKAESIWLEVRESNQKARSLYEALGFNEVDRRYNYYPSKKGKEDAVIMSYLFF
ncbi:ribosomal protein S18-alanine N-acetyltransferase [Vibrio sp. F74]|uniref:ribosomal protein S18-alanine N-acetyltransferase n=1 Tax=Vibrio sp. F74 TaxID=700020 RepID=UPI0035F55BA7